MLNRGQLLAQGPLEQVFGDAELIERAGLRLPLVAQLFHELASEDAGAAGLFDKLPLTVGQAKQMLMERGYPSMCKNRASVRTPEARAAGTAATQPSDKEAR